MTNYCKIVDGYAKLGIIDEADLPSHSHDADDVNLDVTAFDGNLSSSDTTVQAALDTLDDLAISSLPSGTEDQTIRHNGSEWVASNDLIIDEKASTPKHTKAHFQPHNTDVGLLELNLINANLPDDVYHNQVISRLIIFAATYPYIQIYNNSVMAKIGMSSGDNDFYLQNNGHYIKISSTGKIKLSSLTANTFLKLDANKEMTSVSASDIVSGVSQNGWMRKSVITDIVPFVAGVATYVFSWDTATYSENWNTSINRTTTDRLTNELTTEQLLRDNVCIEIETTDLDKSNISNCYAELHWARYDETDTLIEELILDKAWVMMVAAGGTIGNLWGDENLFLQGDIEYTLDEDHYSKMWVEVYYDGPGANVSLTNGMQEHHHFKY